MTYAVWLALVASMPFATAFAGHQILNIDKSITIGRYEANGRLADKLTIMSMSPAGQFCLTYIFVFDDGSFSDINVTCDPRIRP